MKKLFFTLTLIMAITSLSFASFTFTIYNNNEFASCTYSVTAFQVCDNASCCVSGCTPGGPGCHGPWVLSPGNTYTFSCPCSGTPNWSTLSVTIKGTCNTNTWGNSSGNAIGNCNNCDMYSGEVTVWTRNSDGSYEIRPDFASERKSANGNGSDVKNNNGSFHGELIEEAVHYGNNNGTVDNLNGGKGVSSFESFPNPVSTLLNINYELNQDAEVLISIYDITGKQVLTSKQGILKKGKNSLSLDVSSLPNGIYDYSFKAGESILTRKVSLVK